MDDFIAARMWAGSKPGYVFKADIRGVGYYLDPMQSSSPVIHEKKRILNNVEERPSKRVAVSEPSEMEAQEDDAEQLQALDAASLKVALINFEKKINRNQQMRMKFAGEPAKFMESEIELNDAINELFPVAASPELYPLFVSLGAIKSLLGTVAHENTDVSLAAVSLLQELTDPDTLLAEIEDETVNVLSLLDALVAEQGLELITQNLGRLDETQDEDALGVSHTLTIIENIVEVRPELAEVLCTHTHLLQFLLRRLGAKNFDANKLHVSEVLAILLQSSSANQSRLLGLQIEDNSGFEVLLQLVFASRKTVPESEDESECIENIFLSLRSALLVKDCRDKFLEQEGFELMVKCMKEGAYAAGCAVKTLSFALSGSLSACSRLVAAGGLKYIFPIFSGKSIMKSSSHKKKGARQELEETAVSILSELCSQLVVREDVQSDQETLVRLVAKFQENDREKLRRAVELFFKYTKQLQATEHELAALRQELEEVGDEDALEDFDDEDSIYSKMLSGGLFTLQQICKVLAFACMSDKEAGEYVTSQLTAGGANTSDVVDILREAVLHLPSEEDDFDAEMQRKVFLTFAAAMNKIC